MKKVLLTLLAVILIVGALGAAGMAGYRYGYAQGISSASNSDAPPSLRDFGFGPQRIPGHNFGFDRNFGRGNFPMMGRDGPRFGFFFPLMFLAHIAFWALVIWAIYTLIARSGWRLTKTSPTVETTVEEKES